MTEDIKGLVKRLRDVQTRERILGFGGSETLLLFSTEAADAIEALAGGVEVWKTDYGLLCDTLRDDRAERDRLKAALLEIKQHEVSREQFIMQGPAFAAGMVSRVIEIARKALGDAS